MWHVIMDLKSIGHSLLWQKLFLSLLSAHAKPADTRDTCRSYCRLIKPNENGQVSIEFYVNFDLHLHKVMIKGANEGVMVQVGAKEDFKSNFTAYPGYNISLVGESNNNLSVEISASALKKLPDSRYRIIQVEVTEAGYEEPKVNRTYLVELEPGMVYY